MPADSAETVVIDKIAFRDLAITDQQVHRPSFVIGLRKSGDGGALTKWRQYLPITTPAIAFCEACASV